MVGVIIEYDRNTDAGYFSPKSKEKRKNFQQNSSKIRRIFWRNKGDEHLANRNTSL